MYLLCKRGSVGARVHDGLIAEHDDAVRVPARKADGCQLVPCRREKWSLRRQREGGGAPPGKLLQY
ncbi:hypothetical protein A5707_09010 [Mycobacterium kyorinense]|uniref:Uncharacterized protein n=1 Tax=Mycobacterium kyorinense TaxID=487514 RepID=A0A1A2YUE5_9MYCO|nr:hypothetical protein A5707_09010 [Mycobacterium kyorinense]